MGQSEVNTLDLNNLFLIKAMHYGPKQLGHFAMANGLSTVLGGKLTLLMLKRLEHMKCSALQVSTLVANGMWTAGMVSMALARRTSQVSLALLLWTFGQLRSNSATTYLQRPGPFLKEFSRAS